MTEEEATKAVEPVDAAEPAHEVSDVSTGTKRKVSSTELEGEDATTESVKRSKADDKEEEAAPEAAKEEVPAKKKDVKGKGKAKAKSKGKSRYAELDQEDDDDEDDDGDDGYDDGNVSNCFILSVEVYFLTPNVFSSSLKRKRTPCWRLMWPTLFLVDALAVRSLTTERLWKNWRKRKRRALLMTCWTTMTTRMTPTSRSLLKKSKI